MNKLFENTLTTIIGLALIWGEFGGLFHSYKNIQHQMSSYHFLYRQFPGTDRLSFFGMMTMPM